MRAKAAYYASELRYAYPVFLAGRLLGPNSGVRRSIGDLERRIHSGLGAPAAGQRCKSALAVAAALWTGLSLKLGLFEHPKLKRTTYRIPSERWSGFEMWEELHRKFSSPDFSIQVELQHAKQQVWLRFEGVLSRNDAEGLAQRISESLAQNRNRLVIDLKKLRCEKAASLKLLLERLGSHRSRIRLVLPRLSVTHPELVLLAEMFHHYQS